VTIPFATRPTEPSDGAPNKTCMALMLAGLGMLVLCGFGAIVLVCIRTRHPPKPAFDAHGYAMTTPPYAASYALPPPPTCPAHPPQMQAYATSYRACIHNPERDAWFAGRGYGANDNASWPLSPTKPICFSANAPHEQYQRPATPLTPSMFYHPASAPTMGC